MAKRVRHLVLLYYVVHLCCRQVCGAVLVSHLADGIQAAFVFAVQPLAPFAQVFVGKAAWQQPFAELSERQMPGE